MKKIAIIAMGAASILSTCIFAGSTVPVAPSFEGVYLGVGGAFDTVNLRADVSTLTTSVSSTFSITEDSIGKTNDTQNRFVPVADLGYWHGLSDDNYVGIKGVYKYLNHEAVTTLPNTFFTGSSVSTLKTTNEGLLLATYGQSFGNWMPFVGAGASLFTVKHTVENSRVDFVGNVTKVSGSKSKTLWGGAFQAGFSYLLPHNWLTTIAYSFAMSSKSNVTVNTQLVDPFATSTITLNSTHTANTRVTDQGVSITLNKLFHT